MTSEVSPAPSGTGAGVNVIALSQRCPHLGCRPEPCLEDWWMHCPCHQSRYDRLGIKPAGTTYGPAPRGMDRFAVEVAANGVVTIDTSQYTFGNLDRQDVKFLSFVDAAPYDRKCQ